MEANEKNKHHHGVSTRVNAEAELAITFSTCFVYSKSGEEGK